MRDTQGIRRLSRSYFLWLVQEFRVVNPPKVVFKPLPGKVMGQYDGDDHLITLDVKKHYSIGELLDTIGHELAHSVTPGENRDHGPRWKRFARLFGAIPKPAGFIRYGCRGRRALVGGTFKDERKS